MGDEIRLLREYTGRETLFLGKVAVYSAGATFMSAFPADKRFLTKGTRIMIHERIMQKTVQLGAAEHVDRHAGRPICTRSNIRCRSRTRALRRSSRART